MTTTSTPPQARQTLAAFLSSQHGTAVDKVLASWTDHISDGVGVETALTAKQIMDFTGLSRTTVNSALRKLAENGAVIRLDQDKVTTWSLTPTRKAAVKRAAKKATATKPVTPRKSATRPTTKATVPSKGTKTTVTDTTDENATRTATGRRTKGAIDAEILAFFAANPEPAGSYAVAKGIGSSAGAAYVALRRMDRDGAMRLVSSDPDRYQPAS